MLGQDDKFFLSVSNVLNKNGEKYLIHMSLPTDFTYISFPDDVVKVSVYEQEIKKYNKIYNAFNILVGEVSTLEELDKKGENIALSEMLGKDNCIQVDDFVCYFRDEDDDCVIFSKIEDGDVVVKDTEELEEKLKDISDDFKSIQKGINKIKKYSYKK